MKLETIEDFRRVAKALRDLDSTPQQYAVANAENFGYCTYCHDVTEFRHAGHKFEQTDECQKCYRRFGTAMGNLPSSGYTTETSEMPPWVVWKIAELGALPSRKRQTEYFLNRLKQFMDSQDYRTKEAKKEVRAAAKTAGDARKILAAFV